MNFKGKSIEEIQLMLDDWKKQRKGIKLLLSASIMLYSELLIASRQAVFQLKKEKAEYGKISEYSQRAIDAKATLGNLQRFRKEYF